MTRDERFTLFADAMRDSIEQLAASFKDGDNCTEMYSIFLSVLINGFEHMFQYSDLSLKTKSLIISDFALALLKNISESHEEAKNDY